jgi:hypothetical protein
MKFLFRKQKHNRIAEWEVHREENSTKIPLKNKNAAPAGLPSLVGNTKNMHCRKLRRGVRCQIVKKTAENGG